MRKIIKRLTVLFVAAVVAVFALFGTACDKKDSSLEFIEEGKSVSYTKAKNWGSFEVYKHTYSRLGEDVFPIGGFAGPFQPQAPSFNGQVQPDFLDDYYWELFADCGVNMIVFTRNEYREMTSAVNRALDQAAKHNMLFFVRDYQVNMLGADNMDSLASVMAEYINHEGCGGIYGLDEPKSTDFARLKLLHEEFKSLNYEDRDVYINMLPNYATTSAFGDYKTYEAFLRGYMEEVKMPYLSYDYYPFLSASDNLDNINLAGYFKNIATIRAVAEDYKVPFWAFVQAGGQWSGEGGTPAMTEYPLYPSESAFLWNINTLLAYGMKGMEYFDLIQDPILEEINIAEEPNNGRNYTRFGIVGALGNINQWYYYAVKAAKQIHAIDEVLLNASSQGIIAVGSRASQLGTGEEIFQNGKYRELTGVNGNNVIVGCFDYQGRTALYVVNNSIDEKQKINLSFDAKYGYDVTQRGETVSVAAETLPLTLEAGEGVLVVLRGE